MTDRFYVTTPIYYVNGTPHIGHAYTTLLADVLTRYHRLFGRPARFLTGTDEHGLKVQQAAESEGLEPRVYCDRMVVRFKDQWSKLGIHYDRFIRTTDHDHIGFVQQILERLWEKGQIYRAPYKGWYCVPDERFWTEKDITEGACPDCGRPVVEIEEDNYFFRMSAYREWLIEHIESHPGFIYPESRRNEVLGFLRRGLGDLCISRPRTRLAWGIPIPFDDQYVTYVWFDALLNYVTAVRAQGIPADGIDWWPADLHLIGKDIVTTHCVYWPTMLRAAGLELPRCIAAHGWWLVDEQKMSKSRGNVVAPLDLVDRYGVDAFRYFLMRDMAVGQDRSFSEVELVQRYNADLANDLGNALSRVTRMIARYREGVVGEPGSLQEAPEQTLLQGVERAPGLVRRGVEGLALHEAIEQAMTPVRLVNRYLEQREPWQVAKDPARAPLLDTILYTAVEALRIAAVLLGPVMPERMAAMRTQLGEQEPQPGESFETLTAWGRLSPGRRIPGGEALFPRAELPRELTG
jgi:methionyl-tRNA synthetase